MQVGQITPYNLQKNFTSFYYELPNHQWPYASRVLHNGEQIIRCQLRDATVTPQASVKYWNMDGTPAAQFTIGSGGVAYTNILDVTWIKDEQRFAYVMVGPAPNYYYQILKCDPDGSNPTTIISDFNGAGFTSSWATAASGGYVGITCSTTDLFLKAGSYIYKFREGLAGPWAAMSSTVPSSTGSFHYGSGINCLNLLYQSASGIATSTASGSLLYTWYDPTISILYLRSIDAVSFDYQSTHWAMLGISEYGSIQYPLFLNQLDNSAYHVLRLDAPSGVVGTTVSSTVANLSVFNIDPTLAAFLNVNSSDTVMPAGIGATSTINAKVINCWGTTLSGKLVKFWVSSGDGGVNPSYAYTDNTGAAATTFTTGANVGISNVAVVVNEV